MDWKKRFYVLGVALLCTGVLLAAAAAGDPAARKAVGQAPVPTGSPAEQISAARSAANPDAALQAAGGVQPAPAEPTYVISHTANLPQEDRVSPEEEAKMQGQAKELTEEEKILLEEPAGPQSVAAIAESGGQGGSRAACVGDKDINGAGTTNFTYMLNAYWASRRVTSIYLASELNCDAGGEISAIRYYVSTVPTAGYPFTNFQIAVRHTTASAYTSPYCFTAFPDDWTIVYSSASQNITSTGWNTFTFTAPFMYNGVDNLEVDVSWGKNPSDSGNTGAIWAYATGANRTIYGYTDSVTALPPTWACAVSGLYIYNSTNNPRAQFIFPPPTTGACCVNYVCVATNEQPECDALSGTWYGGQDCATFICPPWNDNCSAVTPTPLTNGVPVTFNGNNLGSTNDCAGFAGGQTWEAFSLPGDYSSWTVTLDYCTTAGPFGNAWLNLATTCPCSTNTAAGVWNTTDCGDGNLTVTWRGLAPGNYWYPVLLDPANNAAGPYTIHVVAVPGYCASNATSTADETIKRFALGTIDNTTTNCDTYDDFTAQTTDLQRGSTYPFTLVIGDCEGSSCYTKRAVIYVDWNQDYDFADTGEQAWYSGATAIPNTPCPEVTVTGNITVPVTATLGATRIRVIVVESAAAAPAACGTYSWGATEDYTGVIQLAPPTGACCFGMTCEDSGTWTEADCLAASGRYMGDGSTCGPPNPCFGACCFLDGSCLETIDAAACTAAGGINFSGTGTTCTPNLCPQPGANCGNPVLATLGLADLPYQQLGKTNCGYVDDYDYAATTHCLYYYDSGEDILYQLTVTEAMDVTITLNPYTTTYAGIAIGYSCPPMDNCIAAAYSSSATPKVIGAQPNCLHLEPGTYYIMVDTWSTPDCIPTFDLKIEECIIPTGACCVGEVCTIETATACAALTGTYVGDNVPCDPNPCAMGACCFWPSGDCQNLTEEDCTTAGGTFHSGVYCAGITCPTPGNDCSDPMPVELPLQLPYSNVNTNCGRLNSYSNTCLGSYDGGEDIIYQITVTEDVCVNVDMDTTATWTGMAIDDSCPLDPTTCLYKGTVSGAGGVTLNGVMLYASVGTYYLMIDTYPSPTCIPQFTLTMTSCPTGACCVGSTCTVGYQAACTAAGGVYVGDGTTCDDSPCLMGACCIYSPTQECQNTDEPTCAGLGGFWNVTKNCATFTCPAVGNTCGVPLTVAIPAALPYTDPNQTTCGRVNDYADTCLGSYDGGEDIIYQLVVTEPTCVSITATGNTTANNWIGLAVDDVCPLGSPCMYAVGVSGTVANLPNVALPPGTYYVMVDTYPSPTCLTDFTLTITTSTGCLSGACCLPSGCQVMFQDSCLFAGGLFLGVGSVCLGEDCNVNGIEDVCDIGFGTSEDCNNNNVPDECDIAAGDSLDVDLNGIPDECQPDCQPDGIPDTCQVPGGCLVGNCAVVYPDDCGLSLDCQPNTIPDECELGGKGPRYTYQMDDGVSEDGIGVTVGADDGAIAGHTVVDGGGKITSISVAWGGSTDGSPATVYVWSDPNQDGNPADAVVLGSETTTTQSSGTDTFITIPLDPPVIVGPVGTKFFVGFIVTSADYVVAIDQTAPVSGRNWLVASAYSTPPIDPNDLDNPAYNNALNTLEGYGFPGNLMIRAEGASSGGDCNNNGIPDDCDIMYGPSLDIDGNGVPDECQPDCNNNGFPDTCDLVGGCSLGTCSTDPDCGLSTDCQPNGTLDECDLDLGTSEDCNANELPDECDIANGTSLDCNGNGVPDECDLIFGTSHDWDGDGVPDDCQEDCNENGYPDFCDLPGGCDIGAGLPDGGCANDPFCGQSLDCQGEFGNGIPDECELGEKVRASYVIDDGTIENSIGISAGADLAALVEYVVVGGGGKITSISVAWGSTTDGKAATVYVWSDPNQDGSPADAVVLGSAPTVTANSNTGIFNVVPLAAPVMVGAPGTKFFVGFIINDNQYPIALDQTSPVAGRNWIVGSAYATPPIDPNDLDNAAYNVPLNTTEGVGFAGNLFIRAEGIPAGGDCNNNGVPDDCDIEDGTSADCNGNGMPDECDVAPGGGSNDCNYNGVPDECDISSGASEDCNGNGNPDECDISNGISPDCQNDGIPDECQLGGGGSGGQVVVDPGFEAGVANPNWASTSTNYGTVLCDAASCGTGGGTAGPHAGLVWAWFGGGGDILPEIGTLSQSVTIPAAGSATLKFWLWIGSTANVTADTFTVQLGGNTLFSTDSTDPGYAAYTEVVIDVTAYADGVARTLLFTGMQTTATTTNFNLDDVTITTPGSAPANDCNMNGKPDECDIDVAFGGYCYPFPPFVVCSTDYNGNGVPDDCELCGDFTATATPFPPYGAPDGLVDAADYWYIHDGIGFCLGHPKYDARPLADMDGDGCITLVDYQNWLMCYRMANGKVFVPPRQPIPREPVPLPSQGGKPSGGGMIAR